MNDLIPATPTLQVDNDTVRITRWHLPPGSETGAHVHEYDYVVVPIKAGTLTIIEDDGSRVAAPLGVGESYFRRAGVSHNVTNIGQDPIVFVEVEIKS